MKKNVIAVLLTASILSAGISVFAAPTEPTVSPAETISPSETSVPFETAVPSETTAPTDLPSVTDNPLQTPSVTVSPSATTAPRSEELSTQFNLHIDITPHKYIIPNNAVIELYNDMGELVGSQLRYVGWDRMAVDMQFDVPEYRMGDKFKIKLVSGLRSISYNDEYVEAGGMLEVDTYGYTDENGVYTQSNGCTITGNPHYDKELNIYHIDKLIQNVTPHARIVDGVTMMPVRAIGEAIGLKVTYDPNYDSVVCSVGNDQVIFNANTAYTTVFGEDTYAPHATVYLEGSLFVPVRTLAEAFGSKLEVADYGEYMDIIIGESPMVKEFRNQTPVNRDGIGSKTNYLVWVSKHEYKVRVYEGQQYNWSLLQEFPCALGAWNTPTITGQFEYLERTQWDYGTYYVGPVLRFYNGYALHSTLLYYGGGEYDGRVGVNISHGCVRLHPQDINWIANTIPFGTRIYITE